MRITICSLTVTSGPNPARVSGMGEEAATPGRPERVRTQFRSVPRRLTLESRRLPLAPPHSSGKFKNSHVFDADTLRQIAPSRNRKTDRTCAEAVDVETCLWKAEENRGAIFAAENDARGFNNLDTVQ